MSMNNPLVIIFPIIIAAGLFLGFNGLQTSANTGTGICNQKYQKFIVPPFIKDWQECRRQRPCGTDNRFPEHNAKALALQCLCQDIEQNDALISELYKTLPLPHQESRDLKYICQTGSQPQGRL